MGYRKTTILCTVLVILEGCNVLATSLVSSSEASVTQTASIGAGGVGGASCGQFVIPAIIKPVLQPEYPSSLNPSYAPSVPSFNNYPVYPPPCYPPVFIDGGNNRNNRWNNLLYFLIIAMNRRGGNSGGYDGGYGGGYGGSCGCNSGGCNNGCGYNNRSGCNNGYSSGCSCNSGCTYCNTPNVSTDTSSTPLVSYGDDIVIQTSSGQSGTSGTPIRLIISTDNNTGNSQ